jgi:hypothetical protein
MPASRRSRNPERVFRESAEEATIRVAQQVVDVIRASELTPVLESTDPNRREGSPPPGTLKYGYRVVSDGQGGALIVNEDAPYWVFVEFGTKHMAAQSHVRLAIDYVQSQHT